MKYKDWLMEWLENYVKHTVKERTYERYRSLVALHILPYLGEYELDAITPLLLQKYMTEMMQSGNQRTGKGLSPNFMKSVVSVIQNSLKTAHILGLTAEYTADKIKRPKIVEKQVECFTIAEQRKIEQYVLEKNKDRLKGIILCL